LTQSIAPDGTQAISCHSCNSRPTKAIVEPLRDRGLPAWARPLSRKGSQIGFALQPRTGGAGVAGARSRAAIQRVKDPKSRDVLGDIMDPKD
jgi:hypothetical protein